MDIYNIKYFYLIFINYLDYKNDKTTQALKAYYPYNLANNYSFVQYY